MTDAIALIDITSYGKGLKLYAPKGAKITVREYGESVTGEKLYICTYKGQRFITTGSNIRITSPKN